MVIVAALAVVAAVVAAVVQRWTVTAVALILTAVAVWSVGTLDHLAVGDGIYAIVFVGGMVLVAAAADRSGLLVWLATGLTARAERPAILLAATFLAAVAVTTVLNLDTTAVLFTPLAVAIADGNGQPMAPFAVAALLGANFGSMLLPTSNLTNLVLWRHTGVSFAHFLSEQAVIALVATVLTLVGLMLSARGRLPPIGRIHAGRAALTDQPLALASGLAIAALMIGFVAGLPVAPAALVVGGGLVVWRRDLWSDRLPFVLAVSVIALFAAAGALRASVDVASNLAHIGPLGLALWGAGLANVGSNLTAVLVLEPVATTGALAKALLIGVNLGAGLTPIASLATILWRDAIRSRGLAVPWRTYFVLAAPLSIAFVALTPLLVR